MKEPQQESRGRRDAERDSGARPIFTRAARSAGELGELGWSAARNVTATLVSARSALGRALKVAGTSVSNTAGLVTDAAEDVRAYFDPSLWAEDVYAKLGIATTARIEEVDDRIDRVEGEIDHVARQRAREELLLLRQRIGELERIVRTIRREENDRTRDAMGSLLGRLSDLETRIDSMPWKRFDPGAV